MITKGKFQQLQKLFYTRVTSSMNPSTVLLKFYGVTATNDFEQFTGDGTRTVTNEINLGCFYVRNISDKQRERMGITQDVTDVVYISPLDLKAKYGISTLPDFVRNSYSQIEVEFLGNIYEIVNIKDLEPMHDGKEWICLAYQFNLKQ